MSNFKDNWISFGRLLLMILALMLWPVTLIIGVTFLLTKIFDKRFWL